jgi:hypothetical protein
MRGTNHNEPPDASEHTTRRPDEASPHHAAPAHGDHFAHVEHHPDGTYYLAVWSDVEQNTCVLRLTGATPAAEDVPAAATARLKHAGWHVPHAWIRRGNTWRTAITLDPAGP